MDSGLFLVRRFTHAKGSGVVVAHGAPGPSYDFVGTWTGIISYGGGPQSENFSESTEGKVTPA
jgi:hypothetical protein